MHDLRDFKKIFHTKLLVANIYFLKIKNSTVYNHFFELDGDQDGISKKKICFIQRNKPKRRI